MPRLDPKCRFTVMPDSQVSVENELRQIESRVRVPLMFNGCSWISMRGFPKTLLGSPRRRITPYPGISMQWPLDQKKLCRPTHRSRPLPPSRKDTRASPNGSLKLELSQRTAFLGSAHCRQAALATVRCPASLLILLGPSSTKPLAS
ncbi:hypothetical protein N656DRAFT_12177 [Canariomyces notabilis]|uniref:Uncharacterized protein n=1 Tax=Canariomyces notabilis TaxID=2074819 RepID=A0AAN6YWY5_9PEZI|nr:hypothetical protein N656DRAFT_12177 [Canariomyces arenarius]